MFKTTLSFYSNYIPLIIRNTFIIPMEPFLIIPIGILINPIGIFVAPQHKSILNGIPF